MERKPAPLLESTAYVVSYGPLPVTAGKPSRVLELCRSEIDPGNSVTWRRGRVWLFSCERPSLSFLPFFPRRLTVALINSVETCHMRVVKNAESQVLPLTRSPGDSYAQ